MSWLNADGLRVYFGAEAVQYRDPRGEAQGAGETRTIDVIIDLAETTNAVPFVFDNTIIPANSYIQSVAASVITAVTGATDLILGTQYYDGTEYDYNGLISAMGSVTAGEKTPTAGAQVGTTLASPGRLAITTTGQATAGRVSLRVHILVPGKAAAVVWHGA